MALSYKRKAGLGPNGKVEEREAFAQWFATPENLRRPQTQLELSKVLGVTNASINLWKSDYRVLRRQAELMNERIIDAWPRIIEAACETAMDTSNPKQIQAIKLLADWHEQTRVPEEFNAEDLSTSELKAIASKLYDQADEDSPKVA